MEKRLEKDIKRIISMADLIICAGDTVMETMEENLTESELIDNSDYAFISMVVQTIESAMKRYKLEKDI